MRSMLYLTSYVLKAAIRDKLFLGLIGAIIIIAVLSQFLGYSAILEKAQFSLVYMAGSIRLVGVLGLTLFVVFYIRRSFETKDIDFLLARPIDRLSLVLAYALSFSVIALGVGLSQGFAIWLASPEAWTSGHALWAVSIIAENIVMVNVAFFISMVITSQTLSALIVIGFYVLSRLMGQILSIIYSGKIGLDLPVLDWLMQAISLFMPRLDLFGQSSWLLYGYPETGPDLIFILLQLVLFLALILSATALDLVKREF